MWLDYIYSETYRQRADRHRQSGQNRLLLCRISAVVRYDSQSGRVSRGSSRRERVRRSSAYAANSLERFHYLATTLRSQRNGPSKFTKDVDAGKNVTI